MVERVLFTYTTSTGSREHGQPTERLLTQLNKTTTRIFKAYDVMVRCLTDGLAAAHVSTSVLTRSSPNRRT